MYIEYLDLPHIPGSLVEGYDVILNHPAFQNAHNTATTRDFYTTRRIQKELDNWLRYCPDIDWPWKQFRHLNAQYQILSNTVPIHKDSGRSTAYNYILYPGGDNVVTNIYDNDFNVIESLRIEPFRWHKLNVLKYHNVANLDPNLTRISVTVNKTIGRSGRNV